MSNQKIGEINGKWALLFKALLALNGIALVPWATWQTLVSFELRQQQAIMSREMTIFFGAGPRYTPLDAERDQLILRTETKSLLNELELKIEKVSERLLEHEH